MKNDIGQHYLCNSAPNRKKAYLIFGAEATVSVSAKFLNEKWTPV